MRAGSPASSRAAPRSWFTARGQQHLLFAVPPSLARGSRRADGGLRPGWEGREGRWRRRTPRPRSGPLCLGPQPERGASQTPGPERSRESTTREEKAVSAGPSQAEGSAGAAGSLSRRNLPLRRSCTGAGSASVSWLS